MMPSGGPLVQHETAVAIAAIGKADVGVDLDEHTRMAERRTARNVAGAVADDTGGIDEDRFGRGWLRAHARRLASGRESRNLSIQSISRERAMCCHGAMMAIAG